MSEYTQTEYMKLYELSEELEIDATMISEAWHNKQQIGGWSFKKRRGTSKGSGGSRFKAQRFKKLWQATTEPYEEMDTTEEKYVSQLETPEVYGDIKFETDWLTSDEFVSFFGVEKTELAGIVRTNTIWRGCRIDARGSYYKAVFVRR